MRQRAGLVVIVVVLGMMFGSRQLRAEDDPPAGSAEEHKPDEQPVADKLEEHAGSGSAEHDGAKPDENAGSAAAGAEHHEELPSMTADADGDGMSDRDEAILEADVDLNAKDSDGDGTPDSQEDGDIDNDGVPDAEQEDPPTDPFDADGDGVLEEDEKADRKEFAEFYDDIPNHVDTAALASRSEDAELKPSIDIEMFRKGVRIAKKVVLQKMEKKIAKQSDKKMRQFSMIVVGFSLLGLLLLLMPLALAKKYPGQGKVLFKYSALAAVTFVVTVNLFGGVLYGFRTVQGALSSYTNPSTAIAAGTFDTLDDNAEKYLTMGKELFLPTIEQMRNHPDEQPAVLLLENGQKLFKDGKVFVSVAKVFKKLDFIFSILPIVLLLVTLILFVLAIKPTLTEIIKLPVLAASGKGSAGKEVVANSLRRVKGEVLASICTIGVLVVLTLVSAVILGQIVKPALDALLVYFSRTVAYLQFSDGASSGLVFVTLFGVIMFLVLNLAALILSMSFFLGKSQKIFQQRFNDGTPISTHLRFFKWGAPAVLLVQVFPLLYVKLSQVMLGVIDAKVMDGMVDAESVSWGKLLLAGPAFLVVGFGVVFWAVRGIKAIRFLQAYKVKARPGSTVSRTSEAATSTPPR
jgi:hypothetical protein